MTYIALEGNIGSGKSTISKYMAEKLDWIMLPEPVDGNKFLPLFYENPKRWATMLQIYFLFHRYDLQQVAGHSPKPCIVDRSLMGDRCFAALQKKYGNISPEEWEIYEKGYQTMANIRPPCLMVYLEVDPETAFERIKKRSRSCESNIPLDYLKDLDAEYEDLITQIEAGKQAWTRGIEVVRFPWNGNYENLDNSPVRDIMEIAKKYIRGV